MCDSVDLLHREHLGCLCQRHGRHGMWIPRDIQDRDCNGIYAILGTKKMTHKLAASFIANWPFTNEEAWPIWPIHCNELSCRYIYETKCLFTILTRFCVHLWFRNCADVQINSVVGSYPPGALAIPRRQMYAADNTPLVVTARYFEFF